MKKIYKAIIASIILVAISATVGVYFFKDQIFPVVQKETPAEKDKVVVTFIGNVEKPGKYIFDKDTSLRKALNTVKIKANSAMKGLDLNQLLTDGKSYTILKNLKENNHFSDISEVALKKLGLRSNQITELLKYKNSKTTYTWEEIENLPGIGSKSIEKIKEIYII
ncbi:hypothetical protein CJJ23_02165 [Mycoplasmopsis agassizii]|uniref:Competence protein ComEA n=1 Tax=Mycoplasmopsis agassizii TaxID=33922 RepID=A0A269TJ45_9BACT|nr:hypothetical protein [Mycoplasmopsis agassizii]PAK21431.1 hypothetical protein CJJ23_02165 [Mycoplasmopsis agassizii]